MRFDPPELSGGLGDLGTFVPLTASLIIVCGMEGGSRCLWHPHEAGCEHSQCRQQHQPTEVGSTLHPSRAPNAAFRSGAVPTPAVLWSTPKKVSRSVVLNTCPAPGRPATGRPGAEVTTEPQGPHMT